MKAIALVGLGGAVGAVLRHLVSQGCVRLFGSGFPVGTLVVNVLGSLVLGIVFVAGQRTLGPEWRLVLGTGFCGALTTFSTFSVESLALLEKADWRAMLLNLVLNLVLGVGAAAVGMAWMERG